MNRRNIIVIILLFVTGLLVLGGYVYFQKQNTNGVASKNPIGDVFSALFPFGQNGSLNGDNQNNTTGTDTPQPVITRLRKVSDRPVVGSWFVAGATSTPTMIRFVERATGHVFETSVDTYTETRISNTTIPQIQEFVPANIDTFILRSLSDNVTIANFLGKLNATESVRSVSTVPLKPFDRVVINPKGNTALSVTEVVGGSRTESVDLKTGVATTLLISPIRSWVPKNTLTQNFIETAPSSSTLGYLYEIKKGGVLSKVVGDVAGLMTLPSPSGSYVLYSSSNGADSSLFVLETATNKTYKSPLGTLAEKCAWVSEKPPVALCAISEPVKNVSLPDDWFIGSASLNDSMWLIYATESKARSLGSLEKTAGSRIDVVRMSVSPDGTYALFTNKNDLTLWALNLTKDE